MVRAESRMWHHRTTFCCSKQKLSLGLRTTPRLLVSVSDGHHHVHCAQESPTPEVTCLSLSPDNHWCPKAISLFLK